MLWRIDGEKGLSMQTPNVTGHIGSYLVHHDRCTAATRERYNGGRLGFGS